MSSHVADPVVAEALQQISAGLDQLACADVRPVGVADALQLTREVEVAHRRLTAMRLRTLTAVERGGWHRPDGHANASVWLRHSARTSTGDARSAAQSARAMVDLPCVAQAFIAGRFSPAHLGRIARVHGNDRIQEQLLDPEEGLDAKFADLAARCSYHQFDAALTAWERLADEDGARQRAERNHARRDLRLHQGLDGSCTLQGGAGAADGVRLQDVLRHFERAEWLADWDEARQRLGDATTVADLARTDAQRRWDALMALIELAAAAEAARPGGSPIETIVVIDHETYQRELARLAGEVPGSVDPAVRDAVLDLPGDLAPAPATVGDESNHPIGFRCASVDGWPIEPTEAVVVGLLGRFRRAVMGADGVTIDLGRRARLFTGSAQLAVRLSATHCVWPGCLVPTSECQTDHLRPWTPADGSPGGATEPANGAPLCGRHNRHKHHGYRLHRDRNGTWHTTRPDGTEIP